MQTMLPSEIRGFIQDHARRIRSSPPSHGAEAKSDLAAMAGKGKGGKAQTPPLSPEDARATWEREWRAFPIKDLKPSLKPGNLKALANADPPILTMGDMFRATEKAGDWVIKNIKGFGPSGQEQYAAAQERYFTDHPQPPKPAPFTGDMPAVKDPKVLELSDIRAEEDEFPAGTLAGHCRPSLLTLLQAGKLVVVDPLVVSGQIMIVTMPPITYPDDVYALRTIYEIKDNQEPPAPSDADPFQGLTVMFAEEPHWIGPRSEMLLVRDAEVAAEGEQAAA